MCGDGSLRVRPLNNREVGPGGGAVPWQAPASARRTYTARVRNRERAGSAGRSAVLLVPSYVALIERNVIINPAHPDAAAIQTSLPEPAWRDERLFR